jgi:hypothetical protein
MGLARLNSSIAKAIFRPLPAIRPFYLGPLSSSQDGRVTSGNFVKFSETRHVHPEYQILDVTNDAEETAWIIGLTGKIIESFEIDGSTVAQADPQQNTAEQNHQPGESLVPTRYTISPLRWYRRPTTRPLPSPRERADNVSDDRVICSTHLIDRTRVDIPVATQGLRDPAVPTGFPGLTLEQDVNWIARFQSFLGFKAVDRMNHRADDDSIPNMPLSRLYVFSPYMYTGYEDHRSSQFDASQQRTYWVTNLRTHFGSDHLLIDATHPYKAHPLI